MLDSIWDAVGQFWLTMVIPTGTSWTSFVKSLWALTGGMFPTYNRTLVNYIKIMLRCVIYTYLYIKCNLISSYQISSRAFYCRNAGKESEDRLPWIAPEDCEDSDIDLDNRDYDEDDDDDVLDPDYNSIDTEEEDDINSPSTSTVRVRKGWSTKFFIELYKISTIQVLSILVCFNRI